MQHINIDTVLVRHSLHIERCQRAHRSCRVNGSKHIYYHTATYFKIPCVCIVYALYLYVHLTCYNHKCHV